MKAAAMPRAKPTIQPLQEVVAAAVEVRGLTIGYGDKPILRNLDFSVMPGEVFVVLGGSGCGKTTLLKHLIGLYQPIAGEILIHGRSMVEAEGDDKRELMRRFGVLYQSGALFGSLTLEENVALPLHEYTRLPAELIRAIVAEKLAQVGLTGFGGYQPAALSGGMRKRAGLARAMAMDPEILFFDEPSAGLDPVTAALLDQLILRLRDELGTTMVIVTHELDSIFTVADRVIMLEREAQGIIAEGDPYELRDGSDDPRVREFLSRAGLTRD
jgi:phospholipid/cholesterol/gamma-HCH transport system ATP-binding protein